MAGLYIHIPFCKSRCIYCAFYSTTHLGQRQRYVDALCREMAMRGRQDISTIYLGGGTPSQLTADQLRQLFETIHIYNKVAPDAEVTIEVNPDDVTPTLCATLPRLGVNRVSMGAQTFDNQRLRFLHRRHTEAQVQQAVRMLRDAGIPNVSIDLMYGFPHETLDNWRHDIDAALHLSVEHLSAYCLMVEEGTPLHRMGIDACNEELEREMYEELIDRLTAAGYEHYEISNFAKPGYRSRHNSSYWQDTPYVGIGAAAHSYNPPLTPPEGMGIRSWNVADLDEYMAGMERGERLMEQELIDGDTHYNDRITVALRTRDGLNLSLLTERQRSYCLKEAQRFLDDGLLQLHGAHLSLTRNGLFVSDYIMSELIMV